jgi:flagella basal body P-ring formation protein FlgA
VIAVFAIAAATAASSPHALRSPLVDAAIRNHVAEAVGVPEHDVEVKSNGLATPTSCGPGAELSVSAVPNEAYRRYVNLRLTGQERGAVCADLRIRTEVVVWETVPVAATDIAAGQTIRLTSGRVPRHRIQGVPVDPLMGPFVAVGPMQAGAPVTMSRIRAVPDWKSGSTVTLESGSGALMIRTSGRLLADARNGDTVRVANPATGAVIVGVISADGVVQAQGAER